MSCAASHTVLTAAWSADDGSRWQGATTLSAATTVPW